MLYNGNIESGKKEYLALKTRKIKILLDIIMNGMYQ